MSGVDPYESSEAHRPAKQGRGCFFYGCLTLVIIGIGIGVGGYFLFRKFQSMVLDYTETEPRPLPQVELPDADVERVTSEWERFYATIQGEESDVHSLELSADELNALIQSHPDSPLKDQAYVDLKDGQVTAKISVLASDYVKFDFLEGRYVNGEASFDVSLENGGLIVRLMDLEAGGKVVPDEFLSEMRTKNLAAKLYEDAEQAEILRRLERVEVRDGKLFIEARRNAASPEE